MLAHEWFLSILSLPATAPIHISSTIGSVLNLSEITQLLRTDGVQLHESAGTAPVALKISWVPGAIRSRKYPDGDCAT